MSERLQGYLINMFYMRLIVQVINCKKAAALDYLETKKLVHANVRASNILLFADLPQPHIKLADPGKLVGLGLGLPSKNFSRCDIISI